MQGEHPDRFGGGTQGGRGGRPAFFSLLGVLALALLVRLPFLSLPLTVDEGSYAYIAYWWQRGHTLYDLVWIDRPQGLFLTFVAIQQQFGESTEALRLGVALLNLGTTVLVYAIALRLSESRVALTAAALYAVLSAHPRIEGVIANSEIIMAFPATLSLWLLLTGLTRPQPAAWLAGAGVAAGAAFLVKQAGVAALLVNATLLAWTLWKRHDAWGPRPAVKRGVALTAALLAGFLAPLGLSILHGLATAPAGYWQALAGHRIAYGSILSYSAGQQAVAWLANFLDVWPALLPFLLLAVLGLALGPRPAAVWLWLAWSAWALTLGGEWWGHYYVQLAAPLALLAAQGVWTLAAVPWGRTARRALVATAVVSSLAFVADVGSFMAGPGTLEQAVHYSREQRYHVGPAIAAWLRAHVPPGRGVYVAYEGAEVLYQAQRTSPVRYLFKTDLFLVPGAYEEMLAVVGDPARRPAAVVARPGALAGPGGSGDTRLAALLARDYRPAAAFGAWQVYLERE